jgi:hypothetical protein
MMSPVNACRAGRQLAALLPFLALAAALTLGSTGVLAQALSEARDQLIRDLQVQTVIVETSTDSIELVGRQAQGARVEVTRVAFGYTAEAARRALDRLTIEVTETLGTARVAVTRHPAAALEGRPPYAEVRVEVPPGVTVEVRTASGVVRVREVDAVVRIATTSGGVNASGGSGRLEIQTSSGGVRVAGFGRGNLEIATGSGPIEVLGGGPLELSAASASGHVQVVDVEGSLTVSTAIGGVNIERARNAVLSVETTRGAVSFSGSLARDANSLISTTAGSVRVALPRTAAFRLNATSVSGPVNVTFPITAAERSRSSVVGTAGAGGGLLRLSTTSGPVEVVALD